MMSKKAVSSIPNPSRPSSNWLALQKALPKPALHKRLSKSEPEGVPRKRRKADHSRSPSPHSFRKAMLKPLTDHGIADQEGSSMGIGETKNGESLSALRRMIFEQVEYSDLQRQPGKYIALDCEMVGVGPEGAESVLARVSLVNFHGAVQLDEFVRPRERVVDYRTEFSGVREGDMANAKPFEAVQTQVAAVLKDRILVGHAVHNDLKALLLSHPHTATRDTQYYAGKSGVVKSKHIALRKLVVQEVGATIQGGEHSSVTDARATMAVYRLHRKEWERTAPRLRASSVSAKGKARVLSDADENEDEVEVEDAPNPKDAREKDTKIVKTKLVVPKPNAFPSGGRKGVSSGLSTVVRRSNGVSASGGARGARARAGAGGGRAWDCGGAKGSMRV
ncbi:ribonuclease H-like domain-containing protein [Mycena leptocephala]|nr:ribonuclease H-like domain-containing protein [Mycena leptocephala]